MLSDKGYEILQLIAANRADEITDFDTMSHLEKCHYISYTGRKVAYLTPTGEEACKEYELSVFEKECSRKALAVSKRAFCVSVVSLVVSALISVLSIIISAIF